MNPLEKAAELLQKEFGSNWKTIAAMLGTESLRHRAGKELTSFMAFPERGEGGSNRWRGNCSPEVISAILKYTLDCKKYYEKDTSSFTLLDPMSGSGTSQAVAERFHIRSLLYDLNPAPPCGRGNWNALKNEVDDSADLIFFHPPYHSIIQYSGNMWGTPHPDDLSRCENYEDFLEKLNYCIRKFFFALRKDGRLAILVGDIRMKGEFYSMQRDIMRMGQFESFLVKGQFNCASDSRTYRRPFIPIVTEYMLVYHKEDSLIVPFTWQTSQQFSVSEVDLESLTWHHLIRMTLEDMGGSAILQDLYSRLKNHPKARKNPHYRERIRATLYEHASEYLRTDRGYFSLCYQVT